MTGKIHTMVGIATCTLVMQPRDLNELFFCVAVGTTGGLLPDIDIRNSEVRQDLKEFAMCAGVAGVGAIAYSCLQGISPLYFFKGMNTVQIVAVLALLCTVLVGFLSNHRKFTHSIEFALLVSICSCIIFSNLLVGIGIFVGIISHDLIDTLNKKKVLLSCIFNIQYCANVCTADSKMAKSIGVVAGALVVLYCLITNIL